QESPARARAHRRGGARGRAEAGMDGRRALRGGRYPRGELWPGRERAGASEERVDLARARPRRLRHRQAVAHVARRARKGRGRRMKKRLWIAPIVIACAALVFYMYWSRTRAPAEIPSNATPSTTPNATPSTTPDATPSSTSQPSSSADAS